MIEYIKQHIVVVISITGVIVILVMLIILATMSSGGSNQNVGPVEVSEAMIANPDTTKLEKTAGTAALDNVFSFSNYGQTTQYLYGLLEASTENFEPKINELITTLESDSSGSLSSNLTINSSDYTVEVDSSSTPITAIVTLEGVLVTNTSAARNVTVKQKLVYDEPYWLLDDYQVLNR